MKTSLPNRIFFVIAALHVLAWHAFLYSNGQSHASCFIAHGSNQTACTSDTACHWDAMGPYASCSDGLPLAFDHLYYSMPYQIQSIVLTGPLIVQVIIRVPVFQSYGTIGHFSFHIGNASDVVPPNLYDRVISPDGVCNTMVQPFVASVFPPSYSDIKQTCWPNDQTVLNETMRLQDYVHKHHTFPWELNAPRWDAEQATLACWEKIVGHGVSGAITHVNMTVLNYFDYTLQLDFDAIFATCPHAPYNMHGLHYDATEKQVKYTVPLSIVQTTSHEHVITSSVYLNVHEWTFDQIRTTSIVLQQQNVPLINISIVSIVPLYAPPLLPHSLASAHHLETVLMLTIPQSLDPDISYVGPLTIQDIATQLDGYPRSCYNDQVMAFTFTCNRLDMTQSMCYIYVTLRTEARTDRLDGTSFDTCTATNVSNSLDQLHFIYLTLYVCATRDSSCRRLQDSVTQMMVSFSYPVFPTHHVVQDIDIFALVLPHANTTIHADTVAMYHYVESNVYYVHDDLTIVIVTRPSLWQTYSLRILNDDMDLTAAVWMQSQWNHRVNQTGLNDGLVASPRLCGSMHACDGFVVSYKWLVEQRLGPVFRFNISVQVDSLVTTNDGSVLNYTGNIQSTFVLLTHAPVQPCNAPAIFNAIQSLFTWWYIAFIVSFVCFTMPISVILHRLIKHKQLMDAMRRVATQSITEKK